MIEKRRSTIQGWGVFATQPITKNTRIIEYTGEKINNRESLKREIKYLSEMMNFPGVLFKDEEVMKKIAAAHTLGKPVDGHAPGLRGAQAKQYIEAGISKGQRLDHSDLEINRKSCTLRFVPCDGNHLRGRVNAVN